MTKSIMQDKKECYECRRIFDISKQSNLECHHVIGGYGKRNLSEKYGLKVYLCRYHHTGNGGVHKDKEFTQRLHIKAQEAFEKNYPDLDFLKIFGKRYY